MIPERRVRNLVFICDGTLSSIKRGSETNAGLAYRLLAETGQSEVQRYEYDRGVQGSGWRKWLNAASGLGINHSIRRGYAFLAHHYRPGDRIFLLGYSRGAYAVRSLAGMIGRIGLLHRKYATERHVRLAFRFYMIQQAVVASSTLHLPLGFSLPAFSSASAMSAWLAEAHSA